MLVGKAGQAVLHPAQQSRVVLAQHDHARQTVRHAHRRADQLGLRPDKVGAFFTQLMRDVGRSREVEHDRARLGTARHLLKHRRHGSSRNDHRDDLTVCCALDLC